MKENVFFRTLNVLQNIVTKHIPNACMKVDLDITDRIGNKG